MRSTWIAWKWLCPGARRDSTFTSRAAQRGGLSPAWFPCLGNIQSWLVGGLEMFIFRCARNNQIQLTFNFQRGSNHEPLGVAIHSTFSSCLIERWQAAVKPMQVRADVPATPNTMPREAWVDFGDSWLKLQVWRLRSNSYFLLGEAAFCSISLRFMD